MAKGASVKETIKSFENILADDMPVEIADTVAPEDRPLNHREQLFHDAYMIRCRKGEAAEAAGYRFGSNDPIAYSKAGWDVYNRPHVSKAIKQSLINKSMTAEEVVELVTGQANSDIRDYYRPQLVPKAPWLKKLNGELITDLKMQIAISREKYALRFYDRPDTKRIFGSIAQAEQDIEDCEAELRINPLAFRVVQGQLDMVEELRLDVQLLINDKQKGRVKKVKYGKDGELEVELYSAEAAQDRLLRIAGKFEKDNQRKITIEAPVIIDWDDPQDASTTTDPTISDGEG